MVASRPGRWRTLRFLVIGVFAAAFVTAFVYAYRSGAITPTSVREWLDSLGPWAPLVFVGAFVAGKVMGLPGMAFVVGARLAFGPWLGFACGYVGGLGCVMFPLVIARLWRRSKPWLPKNRWIARAFEKVETHPVRAVIGLRLVFWFNQPIGYALGAGTIRARSYATGCAIAVVPVVAVGNLATGWFL